MTVEQIRKMLDEAEPDNNNCIASGSIKDNEKGELVTYQTFLGLDFVRANNCDKFWEEFNVSLIEFIATSDFTQDEIAQIERDIQLDDRHWDWLLKSAHFQSEEYKWFFLDVEGKTQAVCLIYHPKASTLEPGDIFYIEYVAVAPWNRTNPMQIKKYSGLGSEIIQLVMNYAINTLGLRYGFSLHALPKAMGFYEKIGMVRCTELDKGVLAFYEMPEDGAKQYLGLS